MSKIFTDGIRTPFKSMVKKYSIDTKEGKKEFGYLPWALALAIAERPTQEIVETADGNLVHSVFGGGVVGVAQEVAQGITQVTWLPILNGANQAKPEAKITSRDVSDTINRCRAKAVAMVNGVGLPLFAHGLDDMTVFLRSLNVKPDSDLSTVEPHITTAPEKNGEFIDWPYAIAAARITDPEFSWEVVTRTVLNKDTGEIGERPYFRMGTGWGVAVRVTYKGKAHCETLPIMGFVEVETKSGLKLLDHQPLLNPNCHDWNRAVMRCLVKAIALASGYGLSVYAKTDNVESLHVDPMQRKEHAANDPAAPAEEKPAQPDDPKAKAALIAEVDAALKASGRDAASLLAWLGHKGSSKLEDASIASLTRGLRALSSLPTVTQQPAKVEKAAPHEEAPPQQAAFL